MKSVNKRVWELGEQGLSPRAIAEATGVSPMGVHRILSSQGSCEVTPTQAGEGRKVGRAESSV